MLVSRIKLGLILSLSLLLISCGVPASPPPPTPVLRFITVTPAPGGVAGLPSPTSPPFPTATPSPSSTPVLVPTPVPTPTSTPTPFNAPPPLLATPTPPYPYALINSPSGSLNVRRGPGEAYETLGAYNNGAVVEIIGKQYATQGGLWWLIPFASSPTGQGWLYADYTLAYNVEGVPWVTAPPTPQSPTPTTVTPPPPPPIPHAIIDSPTGFVRVRSGPGEIYEPPLGSFSNGRVVDVIGKQYSTKGELWWLIPFISGPNGGGWIYANDTIARYTDYVPWVSAPPTPTPTVTPTPVAPAPVDWTITGRVIDIETAQPIAGAFIGAKLGTEGTLLTVTSDGNGQFIIVGKARDAGDLVLDVAAQGYIQRTLMAGPATPRVYNFPAIELTPQEAPIVAWAIFGRVTELGSSSPVAGAQVEAILGVDAVRLQAVTNTNGEFSMNGQARNRGTLTVNVTADGYQPNSVTSNQTDSRIYNLPNLQLVPLAGSCRYESVINLLQVAALARLQNLSFTNVTTQTVDVGDNPSLIDRVVNQTPDPPPEGQSIRLSCQIPISLGIGAVSTP